MFSLFKSRKREEEAEAEALRQAEEQERLRAVLPRSERTSSYKEIRITTATGYTIRGIVLDHSDTGLRVRFQSMEALPDYVKVHVPGLSIKGSARIVWRDATDFGLQLIESV